MVRYVLVTLAKFVLCLIPKYYRAVNSCFFLTATKGTFRWFDYLKQTRSMAAPVKLFDKVGNMTYCDSSISKLFLSQLWLSLMYYFLYYHNSSDSSINNLLLSQQLLLSHDYFCHMAGVASVLFLFFISSTKKNINAYNQFCSSSSRTFLNMASDQEWK